MPGECNHVTSLGRRSVEVVVVAGERHHRLNKHLSGRIFRSLAVATCIMSKQKCILRFKRLLHVVFF